MEDPRIISALFIFLKMAYYNVLINNLRTIVFAKYKWYVMYKSMLFRSFDQRLNLLECTKYNHTWGITASPSAARLFIFFFQHLGTEVKVFVKIEIKIRVKGCFSSKFAFSIFIISTLVPHWIAAIEVIAYIVRYICNNQLCWLNSIFFIILHRISV